MDLSQTPSSVTRDTGATTVSGDSGEAIDAGMPVYKKSTDNKYYKATAGDTPEASKVTGIALNSAPGAGQPLSIQTKGRINVGAVLEVGVPYFLSANAGKICLYEDLSGGDFPTFLGMAATTALLQLPEGGPMALQVAIPEET